METIGITAQMCTGSKRLKARDEFSSIWSQCNSIYAFQILLQLSLDAVGLLVPFLRHSGAGGSLMGCMAESGGITEKFKARWGI